MKIFFKYSIVMVTALLFTISCRDEDKVRFPDLQDGVNARVAVHPDKVVLNFTDLANAGMTFDIYSKNTNIKEITYSATFTDADFPTQKFPTVVVKKVPGSAFVNGKASDIKITALELAEAFKLPGGGAYLSGGDSFTYFSSVELTDGRVFNATNSAANITTGTNASFTVSFSQFVSCPFSAAEAAGTYRVTADPGEFTAVAGPLTIDDLPDMEFVAGPGANQVTIKNGLGYPIGGLDFVVDVDPATGIATLTKQEIWDAAYWGDTGLGTGVGSGFFFSCSGFLTLNIGWAAAGGAYGTYKVEWTKKP